MVISSDFRVETTRRDDDHEEHMVFYYNLSPNYHPLPVSSRNSERDGSCHVVKIVRSVF